MNRMSAFATATLLAASLIAAPAVSAAPNADKPSVACVKATKQLDKALQAKKKKKKVVKRLQSRKAAACTVAAPSPVADGPIGQHEPNALENEVFLLLNKERAAFGLPALQRCARLDVAARDYAVLMASTGHYDHEGPDGRSPFDRMSAAGYDWRGAAENIAAGYDSAAAVMQGWMESPGHRANILNGNLVHVGLGYAPANGQPFDTYWVQKFGTGGACN